MLTGLSSATNVGDMSAFLASGLRRAAASALTEIEICASLIIVETFVWTEKILLMM